MKPGPSPHFCATCNKRYGSRNTKSYKHEWPAAQPEPRYSGNLIIMNPEELKRPPSGSGGTSPTRWHNLYLWDGESWSTPYKPFCTLRCALAFATCAHCTGFRVKGGAK